jgi:site-specific DNA-methyltransferase (adenine-specific)
MKIDIFNTDKKYNIIYADPPWKYNDKMKMQGVHGMIRGAESFYNTMTLQDIKSLPIKDITTENAILFMWVTMPLLDKAFEVMKAWGFNYKTCGFCWVKRTKNGKIHLGMGHYTRGNAELCLIGIKKKKPQFYTRSLSQIVESEIRKHSQKPDEIREKIVQLCGDVPRIELFARQHAEGWDCWGNEV